MLRIFGMFRNLPESRRTRLKLVRMTNNKLQMTNHGFRGSTSVICHLLFVISDELRANSKTYQLKPGL
jgi:hypothetical protein